jgi:predicted dehydrogenase
MTTTTTVRIAVAGLGFGKRWAAAYRDLPGVGTIGICDPDQDLLSSVGDELGIVQRHGSLDEVLASDDYDAVHLVTPIPPHAAQAVAVLRSGKHCACAIPMALSLQEISAIVEEQRRTGLTYMLMETEIASPACLFARRYWEEGAFGELQLLRGVHYQNMEGWPDYWRGLPPMYYCYHGLGPALHLAGALVASVQCRGSGALPPEDRSYGSPFTTESALFALDAMPVTCEMTAAFHRFARGFLGDRFFVYGDRMSFESPQVAGEAPVIHRAEEGPLAPGQRGRRASTERVPVPPLEDLVRPELAGLVREHGDTRAVVLAHEFIQSIREARRPILDIAAAANWTAAGICAHESAMQRGAEIVVPREW